MPFLMSEVNAAQNQINRRMTIKIDFKNLKDFEKLTREEVARQVEFAAVQTMTNVAFDVRREVQRKLPQWLNIKRPFLKASVVVEKARFRDSHPSAKVGFLERARLVELLEEGGTRRPFRARNIAIPIGAANKQGKVTPSKRPRAILARDDTFVATINGVEGIWQRKKGRGKTRLQLMYLFEERTTYDSKQIQFFATANRVVSKSFKNRFPKNFEKAIAKTVQRNRNKGLIK